MVNIILDTGNGGISSLRDVKKAISIAGKIGAYGVVFHIFDKLFRNEERHEASTKYNFDPRWSDISRDEFDRYGVKFILAPHEPRHVWADEAYDELLLTAYNFEYPELVKSIAGSKRVYISCTHKGYGDISEIIDPFDIRSTVLLHSAAGSDAEHLKLKRILDLDGEFEFEYQVGFEALSKPPSFLVASSVLYNAAVLKINLALDENSANINRAYLPDEIQEIARYAKQFQEAMSCSCEFPLPDAIYRDKFSRDTEDRLIPKKEFKDIQW